MVDGGACKGGGDGDRDGDSDGDRDGDGDGDSDGDGDGPSRAADAIMRTRNVLMCLLSNKKCQNSIYHFAYTIPIPLSK